MLLARKYKAGGHRPPLQRKPRNYVHVIERHYTLASWIGTSDIDEAKPRMKSLIRYLWSLFQTSSRDERWMSHAVWDVTHYGLPGAAGESRPWIHRALPSKSSGNGPPNKAGSSSRTSRIWNAGNF